MNNNLFNFFQKKYHEIVLEPKWNPKPTYCGIFRRNSQQQTNPELVIQQ
jgi:hypothetical protein